MFNRGRELMHMILARGVDILSLVKKEEMEYILLSDMGTY